MYYKDFAAYLTECRVCGSRTTKAYARKHDGRCKHCATLNEAAIAAGHQHVSRQEKHERS
jgi:hypothetical protein